MAGSEIKNNFKLKSYEFKCKHSLGTPEASKVVDGQKRK
jgi:hypothetical protein